MLLTEGTCPLEAMLTATRGSSHGIKEEASMVRKEADPQFLEHKRLNMNKACRGYFALLFRDPFSFTHGGSSITKLYLFFSEGEKKHSKKKSR